MPAASTTAPSRVLSIDVLRGLTIAFMILVNDPGDWGHTYAQFDHAPWNGFTATDLVFPNFLFLVGASIIFSLQSRLARGDSKRHLALHILRRAALIFAVKMALTAFPYFHYTHFRLYGVLTRIALCYLAAGLLCLVTQRTRNLVVISSGLLVVYWGLMRFVPVPGLGGAWAAIPTHAFPILDPERNLAAWLDRALSHISLAIIHTGTLYEGTRDPEGLLSTLPAIATTLIGAITALYLRRSPAPATLPPCHSPQSGESPHSAATSTPARRVYTLLIAALASVTAGLLWSPWFPINKNLWTSSYVLFAAGLSLLLLAACYWLIDIRRAHETRTGHALTLPWLVFGSNAITAFVLSNFLVKLALWIKVPNSFATTAPAKPISAWLWTYLHLFARHGSTNLTSLAFALAFTALCWLPVYALYRRRIFLKL